METSQPQNDHALSKGFKYGCGGAIGVWVALCVLPVLMLGGCLVLGAFLPPSHSTEKPAEQLSKHEDTLASCGRHECIDMSSAIGFEHLRDVESAHAGQPPKGKTLIIPSGARAKVLGTGKEGCRRIELHDGSRWWVPGSARVVREQH